MNKPEDCSANSFNGGAVLFGKGGSPEGVTLWIKGARATSVILKRVPRRGAVLIVDLSIYHIETVFIFKRGRFFLPSTEHIFLCAENNSGERFMLEIASLGVVFQTRFVAIDCQSKGRILSCREQVRMLRLQERIIIGRC